MFGIEPVEYPTAGKEPDYLSNNPEQRAEELMDAFRDPEIKGVIAAIGGSGEQVRILKNLDPEVLKQNPTRFYGYSDNTSLATYLWNQGIISFYGPMVMTELGAEKLPDYTKKYCEKVFFEDSIGEIKTSDSFTDETLDWYDPDHLEREREFEDNPGWKWHNDSGETVEGRTWGGCLEVVEINLQTSKYLPDKEQLEGKVLLLETSEEMPSHTYVDCFMLSMGERGLLEKFSAVLVGRPKAQNHKKKPSKQERQEWRDRQREVIKKRVDEYAPGTPVVFDLDFGHTDPTVPVPVGGEVRIDTVEKTIEFL